MRTDHLSFKYAFRKLKNVLNVYRLYISVKKERDFGLKTSSMHI